MDADAAVRADAITTPNVLAGVTGPQSAPFTRQPDVAMASLDAVEALDATWVLSGHGPGWDGGVASAVRRVRESAGAAGRRG